MSWTVNSIDRTALPLALLPTVKAHCRVDYPEDDTILKTYTSIALGQLERVWGFSIFTQSGTWTPPEGGASSTAMTTDRWPTPVQPVTSFTAKDEEDADVSADFQLINPGSISTPTYLATIDGSSFPADISVAMSAGYATEAELPPEALGAVLQVTSRLYEYRENVAAFSINQMPMWLNDLLVGLWQPRC